MCATAQTVFVILTTLRLRTRPAAESGGGWLFNTFGMAGAGAFKLPSLLVAVVGASTLLLVYHAALRGVRDALFNLDLDNQS